MVEANPQSIELNNTIKNNSSIYDLISNRGKLIFFPRKEVMAQSADAKGKKINATMGIALEEDLSLMRLKSIAKLIKKLDPKEIFTYTSSFGKPELREKWKEKIYEKNPSLELETSLPITTNGITHGLSLAGYLFINPGDKIIIPDKLWENYELIFTNTYGAELDKFNTFKDKKFDLESFKNKLNKGEIGKKIILLNFPNNPTGYTLTAGEAEKIAEIVKESAEKGNKILVITDDAYFGLVYRQGVYKESIFTKLANLHQNILAVKIDGATKEDYVWGFRVGFITFGIKDANKDLYKALENKTAGAVRSTISTAPHLSQSLVLKAFNSKKYQKEKQEKYELLKSRYQEVKRVLQDEKYSEFFKPLPFNSGYFMCIELNTDAEKVRQTLLEKYSTGVIAMGNLLRIAFSALSKNQIQELFDNIYKACKEQGN
ncbi:aspartate aminotransferase [Candidatus Woesearchaeota archaeon B3_Woes]|nr:MAG: aspartate aminotransferase [Candidatus Woesearchaeota archaeon B3_Woes]